MAKSSQSPPVDTTTEKLVPVAPGAAFTFGYYFAGAGLITTLLAAQSLGLGLSTGLPGQLGLIGGAIGGSLGWYFNRTQTLILSGQASQRLRQELEVALSEMGYSLQETDGTVSLYQRSPLRRALAGNILVQQSNDTYWLIVSRAANIRRLAKRLNLDLHATR
jgi:hypothetical protein